MASQEGRELLGHVLVPLANEEDARRTARALRPYAPRQITLLYVVEKAGGAPDKLSPEQAKTIGQEAFAAFDEILMSDDERLAFGTDITETIFDVAVEEDASVIAFSSRGGGRIVRWLTGDLALSLTTENAIPVLALPQEDPEDA